MKYFFAAEQLSISLQAKDFTVQDAIQGALLLSSHFRSLCNEPQFNTFYEDVKTATLKLTDEPCIPRHRKAPKWYNGGEPAHRYANAEERYRHAYFETFEMAAGEVERFHQADLKIVKEIEMILLSAANGEVKSLAPIVLNYMDKDLDHERLMCQLSLFPDMIKTATDGTISEVT